MPRQYFIPGQGALNETSRRQYFIPGGGAINESGAANLSASFAETLTSADGMGASMSASDATSDVATAGYSYSPASIYFQSFIPGGFAVNEGVARQFFVPGHGAVNLTGRAKIVPPVSVGASYPVAEASTSSDGLSSSAAFSSPLSDFVFASDVPAVQPVYPARLGRAKFGRATLGSSGKQPATVSSTGGVSAKFGRATLGRARFASAGGATRSPTFTAPYVVVTVGQSLSEAISLTDLLSAMAAYGESLSESASPGDSSGSFVPSDEIFTESLAPGAAMAALATVIASVAEILMAGDGMSAIIDIPPPLYRIIKADGHQTGDC